MKTLIVLNELAVKAAMMLGSMMLSIVLLVAFLDGTGPDPLATLVFLMLGLTLALALVLGYERRIERRRSDKWAALTARKVADAESGVWNVIAQHSAQIRAAADAAYAEEQRDWEERQRVLMSAAYVTPIKTMSVECGLVPMTIVVTKCGTRPYWKKIHENIRDGWATEQALDQLCEGRLKNHYRWAAKIQLAAKLEAERGQQRP